MRRGLECIHCRNKVTFSPSTISLCTPTLRLKYKMYVLVPIVRYICLNLQNVFLTQFIAGINTHFLGLGEKAKVYAISAVDLCCTCYPKSKDQVRHINSWEYYPCIYSLIALSRSRYWRLWRILRDQRCDKIKKGAQGCPGVSWPLNHEATGSFATVVVKYLYSSINPSL